MRRYTKLLALFARNSLQTALEYRANFVVALFQSAFWLLWSVVGTLVFFRFTGTLGGWSLTQVFLVIGLFRVFEGVIDGLLRPNVTRLVEHIQKGTFDFILLKPVDSQFMASLREFNLLTLADFLVGFGLIVYGLAMEGYVPTPLDIGSFVVLLGCATVITYSLWMLLVTTAFWLVRVENIVEILTAVYETGRFPVTAFGTGMRVLLTFIIPIAFMTTFPAAALLGTLQPLYLLLAPLLALVLFWASRSFWHVALRSYTSASS